MSKAAESRPDAIDDLPLDLFGVADPPDAVERGDVVEAVTAEEAPATRIAWCQWCGTAQLGHLEYCPACGGNLLHAAIGETIPVPQPEVTPAASSTATPAARSTCQWCATPVTPEDRVCPSCHANLQGNPNLVLPGVNVPLPEYTLAARNRAEWAQDGANDPTSLVIELIVLAARAMFGLRR